jgi:hypothetical protein
VGSKKQKDEGQNVQIGYFGPDRNAWIELDWLKLPSFGKNEA